MSDTLCPLATLVVQVQQGAVLRSTDHNPRSLVTQRYALKAVDALKLAVKRQWVFFLRNKAFIVFRLLQVCTRTVCHQLSRQLLFVWGPPMCLSHLPSQALGMSALCVCRQLVSQVD